MTTFKEIQGRNIRAVSTDPANPGEGEMWYNKTIGILKGVEAISAFSSGGSLSLARASNSGINVGTQTAGLAFAGQTSILTSVVTNTEEYNGVGWANGGAVNTARGNLGGSGTQTAGLFSSGNTGGPPIAGSLSANVEEYDGSTWTEVNNVATARADHTAAGPQIATYIAGGVISTSALTTSTEEYDGTNWTSGGAMPAAREYFSGTGDSTNGLVCGGSSPTFQNTTFLYDGTSWTDGPNLNTGIQSHKTIGTVTDAIRLGGVAAGPNYTTATENYDGTSWSTFPATLSAGNTASISAGGNSTSGLLAGGQNSSGTSVATTEELYRSANVITGAAFSSGGTLNTARWSLGGFGSSVNDMLVFGGYAQPPDYGLAEEYNGTAWTEVNDLSQPRYNLGSIGTTSAGLGFGGGSPNGAVNYDDTEEWNGTSWTASGNYPANGQGRGAAGTQTAGLAWGGYENPPGVNVTTQNTYNGSVWTADGSFPRAISSSGNTGSETAALNAGGGSPNQGTEEYNGTSWTASGNMNIGRAERAGMGNNQNEYFAVGAPPGYSANAEEYNGTSWVSTSSLATGRSAMNVKGGTKSTGMLVAGGSTGPGPANAQNLTEEYNAETTALNIKTFTTS